MSECPLNIKSKEPTTNIISVISTKTIVYLLDMILEFYWTIKTENSRQTDSRKSLSVEFIKIMKNIWFFIYRNLYLYDCVYYSFSLSCMWGITCFSEEITRILVDPFKEKQVNTGKLLSKLLTFWQDRNRFKQIVMMEDILCFDTNKNIICCKLNLVSRCLGTVAPSPHTWLVAPSAAGPNKVSEN